MKNKNIKRTFWSVAGLTAISLVSSFGLMAIPTGITTANTAPPRNWSLNVSKNITNENKITTQEKIVAPAADRSQSVNWNDPLSYLDIQGNVVKGFNAACQGQSIPENFNLVIPSKSKEGKDITEIGPLAFCNHIKGHQLTFKKFSSTSQDVPAVEETYAVPYASVLAGMKNQNNMLTLTLPDSVKKIDELAFASCWFTKINFGKGLTSLGRWAFYKNDRIGHIELPNGLKTIGDQAFAYCTGFDKLLIPSGVTEIGCQAFTQCNTISSIYIPSSVTKIGGEAFDLSESVLQEKSEFVIYLLAKNVVLYPWAFNCEGYDTYANLVAYTADAKAQTYLQSIRHLTGSPTFDSKNVRLMSASNDVLFAGKKGDEVAGLSESGRASKTITIPERANKILDYALCEHSANLTEITIKGTNTEFGDDALYGVPKNVKYHVFSNAVKNKLISFGINPKQIRLTTSLSAGAIAAIVVCVVIVAIASLGAGILIPLRKQHKVNVLNSKLTNKRIDRLATSNAMAFKKVVEATGMLSKKVDQIRALGPTSQPGNIPPRPVQPVRPTRPVRPIRPIPPQGSQGF